MTSVPMLALCAGVNSDGLKPERHLPLENMNFILDFCQLKPADAMNSPTC